MGEKMERTEWEKAVENAKAEAEKGNVEAMATAAKLLRTGPEGDGENYDAAFPYYKMAADNGDLNAALATGHSYLFGDGVEQSDKNALAYFLKVAEEGEALGQHSAGILYWVGDESIRDIAKAKAYLLSAALQNNVPAQVALSNIYEEEGNTELRLHWAVCAFLNKDEAIEEEIAFAVSCLMANDIKEEIAAIRKYGFAPDSTEIKHWSEEEVAGQYTDQEVDQILLSMWERYIATLKKEAQEGNAESLKKLADKVFAGFDDKFDHYTEAFPYYKQLADLGDMDAAAKVGMEYDSGEFVQQDTALAFHYLLPVADSGDKTIQYYVASMYREMEGEEAAQKAEEYALLSAKQNFASAQRLLYFIYVDKEYNELAFHWLCCAFLNKDERATELMEGYGHRIIGNKIRKTIHTIREKGVDPKSKMPFSWEKEDIANQYTDAEIDALIREWESNPVDSEVTEDDYKRFIAEHTAKAKNGNVESMRKVGDMLYQGFSKKEENTAAAMPYWIMAATNGDESLYGRVGINLIKGNGCTKDERRGFGFLRRDALNGNFMSQFLVGTMYESGYCTDPDEQKAIEFYRMSAVQNYPEAKFRLGTRLLDKDLDEAVYWLSCSYLEGNEKAAECIRDLTQGGSTDLSQRFKKQIEVLKKTGTKSPYKKVSPAPTPSTSTSSTNQPSKAGNSENMAGMKKGNTFVMNNNNIEQIRDALAGAVLGAVAAVLIFVVSIIWSTLSYAGGLVFGDAQFSAMSGGSFALLILALVALGGMGGYYMGYHLTQDSVIRASIKKWLNKHNK